jgi:hypothetical protein
MASRSLTPNLPHQITQNVRSRLSHTHIYFPLTLPTVSEWCRIIDTGRKSADGRTVQQLLDDLVHDFPKYELDDEEGIDEFIDDARTGLGGVATVEEGSLESLGMRYEYSQSEDL